jgi:hypothetical protein
MPPPQAMDPKMLPEYFKVRDQIKGMLEGSVDSYAMINVGQPMISPYDLLRP